MEEGFFAIEGESSERNIGNDGDVDMQLGQARRNGGIITRDLIPELYAAIFVKKENDEAAALTARSVSRQGPAIRLPRRYEGESSSNSAGNLTLANGDLQHKRAKVYSASTGHYVTTASSDAGASSSLAGGDYNINQESSVQGTREIFYNYFMWNSGGDENPFDGTGGNDDDDDDDSKTEDLEIRMDLTDDLLHMVFSFLDYGDLCRASMVCRQWRAASAHEDFWRCLKFENRKISIEQFEDVCQRYPNATEVIINGSPAIHLLVMKAISLLRL